MRATQNNWYSINSKFADESKILQQFHKNIYFSDNKIQ